MRRSNRVEPAGECNRIYGLPLSDLPLGDLQSAHQERAMPESLTPPEPLTQPRTEAAIPGTAFRSQRGWARVAGLMYWAVLVVDLTGLQLHSAVMSNSLMLAGSLFTVPLALGLYYALKPVQIALAASALGFRLVEAAMGVLSTVLAFPGVQARMTSAGFGALLLRLAAWDHAASFSAFSFTVGSTIFFALFVKSGYIPRILAWWGLFASLVALAACLTHLLRPAFPAMTMYAWIPMLLAETSTGLWLLFQSVNVAAE